MCCTADTESADERDAGDEGQALPPYEFRINTVRLLAELGVYPPAFKVLCGWWCACGGMQALSLPARVHASDAYASLYTGLA